ncbi:protocadherin Fat 1-like [Babylonia areolata]|uniref:protocadherin Fat 1-like n=1 Tax=Babylonia areolata TaxID=304850 RepID=UPI003FD25875
MRQFMALPLMGWPTWIPWFLLLFVARGNCQLNVVKMKQNFIFTHSRYNGTLAENVVGKVYIKTPIRMGIFMPEIASLNVEYSIVGGDRAGIFHAESTTVEDFCFLRIRTKTGSYGKLNREHRERYNLKIRARGSLAPDMETFTDLNITMLDQNEFSPLFPLTPYTVSIPENMPPHSSVTQVKASDAEVGVNGEIYYSLVDPTPMFAIHPTSGVIMLMRPLDSDRSKYELRIKAEDRGLKAVDRPTSPLSRTTLTVFVTPVNRHSPSIQFQKFPSILENTNPGSIFAVLTITDKDDGVNGEILSVTVLNNTAFRVASTSRPNVFNIIVSSRLDREVEPDFNITIWAVDRGEPSKSVSVDIPVHIQDINDNSPVFEKNVYNAELMEVVPVHTPVLFVKATDVDEGQNGEVRYVLKDDDAPEQFSIDEVTGLISVAGELDAEKGKTIDIVVYAVDRASSGTLTGEAKVIINVLDFNDNAPKFDRDNIGNVFVNENMPEGTSVVTVLARDIDSGDNGLVNYSIENREKVPFDINSFTGEIKTTEVFDFETTRKQYSIIIRASDWGSPYKHWTQEHIVIRVQDVNDNSPQFEKTRCKGYLSREAAPGTEVVILTAIDFDAGNIISYNISDGNEDGCFAIEPSTGSVHVACDLTAYTIDARMFTVVASDGEHISVPATVTLQLVNNKRSQVSATAEVSVTCQETDVTRRLKEQLTLSSQNNKDIITIFRQTENSMGVGKYTPEFDHKLPDCITVPEDTKVGSDIFKMSASDEDEGYTSQILFVITEGNDDGAFSIDTFTGNIKVFSQLDHESRPEYNLTISAQDLTDAHKSSVKIMQVYVSDENDNTPQFEHEMYTKSIFEDVQVNSTVLQVFAGDRDTGLNANVKYTLLSHTEDFYVEADTGFLKVKNQLDREKKPVYNILIQAEDSGGHRKLSSTASIIIHIHDINDNFPEFVPRLQTVHVREDLPVGTVITILTAHDLDEGDNGKVTYKLMDGASNKFQVDPFTGTIQIRENLDYESAQVYNLRVQAEDGGVQSLVSMCLLNIKVVDVNENHYAPEFSQFLERGSVAENSPVGTYVMTVRARDRDEAWINGGRITYSILEGTGLGRFSIDVNGTIRTCQVFDRETSTHFWLTVFAQDEGLVPLFGRLDVLVTIEDVNDNLPQSMEPAYYAAVQENSQSIDNVVQIFARDGDHNLEQVLRFAITGGNAKKFFSIHPVTGMISTTSRSMDREKQGEHILEVTISDNGSPLLSSTTRVVIKVIDNNDQRPMFLDRVNRIALLATPKSERQDIFIHRMVAFDRDEGPNAVIRYTLKSSQKSQFFINRLTGEIFSRKQLKAGDIFDITVRATDNGTDRRRSQQKIRLTVLERPPSSINPPQFHVRDLKERITESDQPGQLIVLLSALDKDPGDKLFFAIEDGNEDKVFTIQPNHGSILLAKHVDWEKRDSYNLTVSVTDGVFKDFTWVSVEVLDSNDNEPVFSHQRYHANVSENSNVGDHVLHVLATDEDKDNRLLYSIASAASVTSLRKFKISPRTGVIIVSEKLDREEMPRHLLTIMVRDQGVPSKKSFARVVIDVADDNDHAPNFLSQVFVARIFGTATTGSIVVQVIATDQDKGRNSELAYSFLSGNVDNTFSIDKQQGYILVARELPQTAHSLFHLVVMATDHGIPPQTSTAEVKITVTISNNAPPVFAQKEIVTEIKENQPLGTVLGAVTAVSQSTVVYTIVDGNDDNFFFLNPNSGVVTTTTVIDYEQHHSFNLTIQASNIVGATSMTSMLVHVSDENDNAPEFLNLIFFGNISEAAEPGTVVLNEKGMPLVIEAYDADSEENALLEFEIVKKDAGQYFSVDVTTGAVRSLASLDHETTSLFNFTVQVRDRGNPQFTAHIPAQVIISVDDINDTPPHFTSHVYMAKVLLPTFRDVSVLTMEATDPDTVNPMPLIYSIIKGNEGGVFSLNPQNGLLSVKETCNIQSRYQLTVQASDGYFDMQAQVVISVEESKDSGIIFNRDSYSVHVAENAADLQNLLVIQPHSYDASQHFSFTLLNNQDLFSVGKTSGVLKTRGVPLDREQQENYTVVVEVTSSIPRHIAHVVVSVKVEDENDNAPMFVSQPFQTVISADSEAGDVVLKVSGIDPDLGKNGEIRYFLPIHLNDNGKDAFAINQYTGDLVVKRLTKVDCNTNFLLTVEATDRGNPPLSSLVDVRIQIVDSAAPMFEFQHAEVRIPEDLPVYSPVKSVHAVSPSSHKLIYSITTGDRYGDFAVDFNTGLVSVASHLDKESQEQYQLVVRATDVLTAANADMHLTIFLQDVNDNKPVFEKRLYTQSVSEAARVGTSILQVAARDFDDGANSVIYYSLAPVSQVSTSTLPFFIHSETGVVMVHRSLDCEEHSEYVFLVVATDNGSPPQNSTATMVITVLDLNDNPPEFIQSSFSSYITDQAKRGQLVTKVSATDKDSSSTGKLAYTITDGNEKKTFTIDNKSGLIRISEYYANYFSPAYNLNVSVSDGVYTSFAKVIIRVRNTNQYIPRFLQNYYVELFEMKSVGTNVVSVSAMDADRGNYGRLTYSLLSQHMASFFSIDADAGDIRTRHILDREKIDQFKLTVSATDSGGQMGFATVTVVLKDENDNMPEFLREQYQASVFFNASIGTAVLQVKAVDEDLGTNGHVQYLLHPGEDNEVGQLFALDEDTGHITVRSSLMFAVNKAYQFFVGAKDQGDPPLENHVPVEIHVTGVDDEPPTFPSKERAFFIQEDEKVGSVIATIRARSKEPMLYSIIPGMTSSTNNPATFSVDDFGQIRIMKPLDREVTPNYTLVLQAMTKVSFPLVATMEINIQLHDINDNAPQFESSPYFATVMENSNISTTVVQVKAFDIDLPRKLEYGFGERMEQMANIFTIDSSTGWISLLSNLDREVRSEYNLTIMVTDTDDDKRISGYEVQLTSSTNVIITVTDYNDNAPVFEKTQFSTAVNEGALPATVILTLISTDKDEGINADVTYYIVSGDPLGQFQIHSNGELFIIKPLDRESKSRYQLQVAATDGGFVTYCEVMVTVLDDNDNAPVCLEPYLEVIENEDVAVGKPLVHVRASDMDEESTLNALIQFTLHGKGADKFLLEKESGVLRTAMTLDREAQQDFVLLATATDGGGLSCVTEVHIFLRDINDNPPEFTGNFSNPLSVKEDAQVGTLLTRITTSDRDTGINRNTCYRLMEQHTKVFSIAPESGIITLVGSLDREERPDYNVTIVAYNEISPEMSSTALLRVLILDVNDNPPVFERTGYHASLSEMARLDTEVVRVKATSLDIGNNAVITYSIAAGNQQGKFVLGPKDGVLRVAEPLDHEVSREYFLTILARDHGSPPLTNTAVVSIDITDTNDNPPLFSQDTYIASISELAEVGMEVFKVMAVDADSYANSVVTYSIVSGNPTGNFVIDPQDGIIQIAIPIDREKVETFTLMIQARDSGSPMLYSTAIVSVLVEDANDNPPLFEHSNYSTKVQEGRRTRIEIITFKITDQDTADNGSPFVFDIVAGDDYREFHISSEGILFTAGKLSKQVNERYELMVRVYDSGFPRLHSDTQVSIHIVNDSIYPPEVGNLSIYISSCVDTFPGGVIGQVEATDHDLYDSLSFSIVSPNRHLFDVHRDDGRLIALMGLDEGDYIVNVSVTDEKFTRYCQVPVTVVCTPKEVIDNAVTFQFANMMPEQFLATYRNDFQQLLKQKLNVHLHDIRIINFQPSAPLTVTSKSMYHSVLDSNLDVLFAVQKSQNQYFSQKLLKHEVQKFADEVAMHLGVQVIKVFSDICSKSTCVKGQCVGSVEFDSTSLVSVVFNGESFVSARHFHTHKCVCFNAKECQLLQCGNKMCQPYEVCGRDLYGDSYCHCPEGQSGPQCQTIISPCLENHCAAGMTMMFSGQSFASWTLAHPTKKRMSLSVKFRTRQSSAILMYAKGQVDYSILAVEEGSLVYRFNCGSGEGQVWVPVDVSDGQWHTVSVERTGRLAEIMLDEAYTAMGIAPGIHERLNLDSEKVYFGAKVDILRNGYGDISEGFEGCMDDIRMFNIPLPLQGSNSIAHSQHFELVSFHCQDSSTRKVTTTVAGVGKSVCSSSECLNSGVCQVTVASTYSCVCSSRFEGARCELDTNPCADFPCHNEGQCLIDKEVPNTFVCHCPNNLLGMRCTYGPNCRPNPCLHGGICIEGPTSALCHCSPGFAGEMKTVT